MLNRIIIGALVSLSVFSCSSSRSQVAKLEETQGAHMRVAFGSCNDQEKDQSYWSQILKKEPQVWVWLGDNIYADTRSSKVLAKKYKSLLENPFYKTFRSQVSITGTWDDHDYGENDAGASFPLKKKSKDLFWDFMQVPKDSVLRSNEHGVYRAEEWSVGSHKVKLLILDTRYERTELKDSDEGYLPTDGDMLGEAQWAWLEEQVSESKDVDTLIVANGTQVLSDKHRFEKWANFPKSRERLLKLVEASTTKNKILLTGDRHFGEISQFKFANGSLVSEATASGLTHIYEKADEPNAYRVGPLWAQTHYGLMDFHEVGSTLKVTLSLVDIATNKIVNSVEL